LNLNKTVSTTYDISLDEEEFEFIKELIGSVNVDENELAYFNGYEPDLELLKHFSRYLNNI